MEAVDGAGKLAAAMAELEGAKATAAAAEAARQAAALKAIAAAREEEAMALAELKAALMEEKEAARREERAKAKAARREAKAARREAKAKVKTKAKAALAADLQEGQDEEAALAAELQEDRDEEAPKSDDEEEDPLPRMYRVKDEPSLVGALGGPPRPRVICVDSVPNMAAAAVMHKIASGTNVNISFPNKFKLAYVARYHEILDKDVRLTSIASLQNNPRSALYKNMLRDQGASVTLMGRSMGGNFGKRANAIGQWMAAYAALEDQPKSSPLLKELRGAVLRLINHPVKIKN